MGDEEAFKLRIADSIKALNAAVVELNEQRANQREQIDTLISTHASLAEQRDNQLEQLERLEQLAARVTAMQKDKQKHEKKPTEEEKVFTGLPAEDADARWT